MGSAHRQGRKEFLRSSRRRREDTRTRKDSGEVGIRERGVACVGRAGGRVEEDEVDVVHAVVEGKLMTGKGVVDFA